MYRLRESVADSSSSALPMFGRAPYRYAGRTLYQTQQLRAAASSQPGSTHHRSAAAVSASMDNCTYTSDDSTSTKFIKNNQKILYF